MHAVHTSHGGEMLKSGVGRVEGISMDSTPRVSEQDRRWHSVIALVKSSRLASLDI